MANSSSMINRMIRASLLKADLYEEVEADKSAIKQAVLVVIVVSIISGLGTGISSIFGKASVGGIFLALIIGIIGAILGWLIWAFITWILGTTVLKTPNTSCTYAEMLRTIGFATSPNVFRFFSFIPILGAIIAFAATIWSLIAGVIAVRQALDISTGRAIAVSIIGWIIYLIIIVIIGIFLGGAYSLLRPIP